MKTFLLYSNGFKSCEAMYNNNCPVEPRTHCINNILIACHVISNDLFLFLPKDLKIKKKKYSNNLRNISGQLKAILLMLSTDNCSQNIVKGLIFCVIFHTKLHHVDNYKFIHLIIHSVIKSKNVCRTMSVYRIWKMLLSFANKFVMHRVNG